MDRHAQTWLRPQGKMRKKPDMEMMKMWTTPDMEMMKLRSTTVELRYRKRLMNNLYLLLLMFEAGFEAGCEWEQWMNQGFPGTRWGGARHPRGGWGGER